MCLIMEVTKDIQITEAEFRANLSHNKDGTGVMFANNGKVVVKKELGTVENQVKLFNKYTKATKSGLKEVFIHSRFATKGAANEDNCHPYQLLDGVNDLWCMHNGTITCEMVDKERSDSYNFLKYYVAPLLDGRLELLDNSYFIEMMGKFIDQSNKLVFMDGTGKVTYVNKNKGVIYKGLWISNEYSGIKQPYVAPNNYRSNKYYGGNSYGNGFYEGGDWDEDDNMTVVNKAKAKDTAIFQISKKEETSCELPKKEEKVEVKANDNVIKLPSGLTEKEIEDKVNAILEEDKVKVTKHIDLNVKSNTTYDNKAVSTGLQLVLTSLKLMSDKDVYNFVIDQPLLAAECLSEALLDKEIIILAA